MTSTGNARQKTRAMFMVVAGAGALFGLWAITAFVALLAQTDWNVTEVIRQYLVATGALAEHETLVDYYTHIKGAEYIIAVAFLGMFPLYYKYVSRTRVRVKT